MIKLFSCSAQLSTKFILLINVKMPGILSFKSMISLLINVKMPTIDGILTFISMIDKALRDLKQETFCLSVF